TIRHRDGRFTDVLYNASVYRNSRGSVLGVFAAARDVTAQKKAEAEVLSKIASSKRFIEFNANRSDVPSLGMAITPEMIAQSRSDLAKEELQLTNLRKRMQELGFR
ncbi:MAG: PAS domain S-box protein, partial [Bdellovibrionota bacterium]